MANYFLETHHHEWLLTNRIGGYALGTGNLVNQRKYHGILIAGYKHLERIVLVSSLEEEVEWRGVSFHLDSNNYVDCIYPEGFLHLVKSWLRPYPVFLYSAFPHNDSILIRKEIMMDADTNTTLVRYKNLGQHRLHLRLRPKLAMRNHHELNSPGTWDEEHLQTEIDHTDYRSFHTQRESNRKVLNGYVSEGEWSLDEVIYRNVSSPQEIANGYAGVCDLVAPVRLDFDLKPGQTIDLLFSDRKLRSSAATARRIATRYQDTPRPADYPELREHLLSTLDYDDHNLFSYKDYLRILEFALDDFMQSRDVIAGYPWFGAWGRSSMVFMQAVLHCPHGADIAWPLLEGYGRMIRGGLIPNVLPEGFARGNYDSVDGALWYILLLRQTVDRRERSLRTMAEKQALRCQALDYMQRIVEGIVDEDRRFCVGEDGLLVLYPNFAYATWMDARVDDECVTPRDGAPIEVNALWYNALMVYRELLETYNQKAKKAERRTTSVPLEMLISSLYRSFPAFRFDDYLADRIVDGEPIQEIRPNALIACSLPYDILPLEDMELILERARHELLTPYGIRTLSPNDFKFRKKYFGSQYERDQAYHQGAVWAWLLAPYVKLLLKVRTGKVPNAAIRQEIEEVIFVFRNGLMKGHIASVAQVWDGDRPHFPKGAPAHASATAALFEIEQILKTLKD